MCVCVCACVRACACARVRVCLWMGTRVMAVAMIITNTAWTPRSGDLDSLFASYAKEISSNNHKSRRVPGYHAIFSMLLYLAST